MTFLYTYMSKFYFHYKTETTVCLNREFPIQYNLSSEMDPFPSSICRSQWHDLSWIFIDMLVIHFFFLFWKPVGFSPESSLLYFYMWVWFREPGGSWTLKSHVFLFLTFPSYVLIVLS